MGIRLTFPSFDAKHHARVAHGKDCVLLLIEDPDYTVRGSIVLTAAEAHALGTRLRQQAAASRRT